MMPGLLYEASEEYGKGVKEARERKKTGTGQSGRPTAILPSAFHFYRI
jgi:hypothetical protein